jgi:hypothetical protein
VKPNPGDDAILEWAPSTPNERSRLSVVDALTAIREDVRKIIANRPPKAGLHTDRNRTLATGQGQVQRFAVT